MKVKSTLRNVFLIYFCLLGLSGEVEFLKAEGISGEPSKPENIVTSVNFTEADEKYGGPNQPDNIVTMTKYLSDSVFEFHYREKYENENHKLVFYPGLRCQILNEEDKTCQLISIEWADLWVKKWNNGKGYYEVSYYLRDCPITKTPLADLDSIPTGMVNGYTIVSWKDVKSLDWNTNYISLYTTENIEGTIVSNNNLKIFNLNILSKLTKIPDIIFKKEKSSININFYNSCYDNYLPAINRDLWLEHRLRENSSDTFYYTPEEGELEPSDFKIILNWNKKMKDKIVEIYRSARNNEPLSTEDMKLLDWLWVVREEFKKEYDLNLPVPRNIYPHQR